MFETLRNAFKIKDIRNRLFFTLVMLVVIRLGCQLPVPGINGELFRSWWMSLTESAEGSFDFFNAFTGGSFERMSIFALNITPYITSSIIVQLMTIAIPKLEEMQRDGEDGRKKLGAITRYLTVALSLIESAAMSIGFANQGLLVDGNRVLICISMALGLTAGSAMLMWIGEQITEFGVGNGISIVLTINIISRIPSDMAGLYEKFISTQDAIAYKLLAGVIILAVILITVILTIVLCDAERRIPVQYSKKMQGRRMVGGQSTHIPLKVNTAGVIPIIFASSLMQFPVVICQLLRVDGGTTIWGHLLRGLSSNNWCNPSQPVYSIGLLVYILLVVFFAYFYTSITFNPLEVANNLKRGGGFIPGRRPGKPTSDYLTEILNAIIFIGAVGLVIVAVIPIFFNGMFNANVTFGGTSLIIIVGVILETIKQIESQMVVRYYKGFLNS